MDKVAQERGLLNKLREKSNITGKILESLNPEFQEMMEKLRATDTKIREQAADVKSNVRAAKSHLNRRDYLSAASNISAFHEKGRFVSSILKKFIDGVDMKHYKFLLDQFDDEQKEQLFGYDPNKELEIEDDVAPVSDQVITAALEKQAGLSDWWFKMTDPLADLAHNLTSDRAHAMRALEKRFSISFLKDLKANTAVMVQRTQRFSQEMLTLFKRLATALAKRNVDQYVEVAKRFISRFAGYHQQYLKYYEKSIVPLKQQHEKITQEQEQLKSKKMEEDAAKARGEKPAQPWETEPKPKPFVAPNAPAAPVVQDRRREESKTLLDALQNRYPEGQAQKPKQEQEQPFPLMKKRPLAPHASFIAKIEKFASDSDVKSLMLEILAFSEKLEDVDADASLKLLAIAEGMMEDENNANMFEEKDPFKEEESDPLA